MKTPSGKREYQLEQTLATNVSCAQCYHARNRCRTAAALKPVALTTHSCCVWTQARNTFDDPLALWDANPGEWQPQPLYVGDSWWPLSYRDDLAPY